MQSAVWESIEENMPLLADKIFSQSRGEKVLAVPP